MGHRHYDSDESTKTDSPPSAHHAPLPLQLQRPFSHLSQTAVKRFIQTKQLSLSLPLFKVTLQRTESLDAVDVRVWSVRCVRRRKLFPHSSLTHPDQPVCVCVCVHSTLAPSSFKNQATYWMVFYCTPATELLIIKHSCDAAPWGGGSLAEWLVLRIRVVHQLTPQPPRPPSYCLVIAHRTSWAPET